MCRNNSLFVLLCFVLNLCGQLPNTEIWLFKIEKNKKGEHLSTLVNITNREGYDNQPSFSKDSKKVYYVSIKEDKQADIYYYDLHSKKNFQITKTAISEYSPIEDENGTLLHSVVVEKDSAQRIHTIDPLNGIHESVIDVDSVGYYCFLNKDTLVYYKLTEPHSLNYYSLLSKESKFMAHAPIRGFKAINRHTLLYGVKDSTQVTFFKYNFLLQKAEFYCRYPSTGEDMIWHPQLGLIKSEGNQLLHYSEKEKAWQVLYNLSSFGFHKITRFAIDTKQHYLVVVDNL